MHGIAVLSRARQHGKRGERPAPPIGKSVQRAVVKRGVAQQLLPSVDQRLEFGRLRTPVSSQFSQQGLAWFVALFAAGWIVSTRSRQLTATKATTAIALLFALGAAQIHPVLAALPLSYAVLGAGALLPSRWFTTNDISYGTYLYGWPIQQLLLIAELDELGLFVFIAAAISLSLAAGAVSWFLLERRCLPKRRSIVTSPTLAPQSITQPA